MNKSFLFSILITFLSTFSYAQYESVRFPISKAEALLNKEDGIRKATLYNNANNVMTPIGQMIFDTGGRLIRNVTALGKINCSYDALGRMIKRGDTISDGKRSIVSIYNFTYDDNGKISKIVTPKWTHKLLYETPFITKELTSEDILIAEYKYDEGNRLVQVFSPRQTPTGYNSIHRYYYFPNSLLSNETEVRTYENGNLDSSTSIYIYGLNDVLLSKRIVDVSVKKWHFTEALPDSMVTQKVSRDSVGYSITTVSQYYNYSFSQSGQLVSEEYKCFPSTGGYKKTFEYGESGLKIRETNVQTGKAPKITDFKYELY